MTDRVLKSQIGLLIVIWHFALAVLAFILMKAGGFDFKQVSTLWALISPILGVYTTSIVKYFVVSRYDISKGRKVTREFTAITHIVVLFFLVFLTAIVVMGAFRYGISFEQTKGMIGAVEAVFGGYFGLVLAPLFGREKKT